MLQIKNPDRDPDYVTFDITMNDLDFKVKILETPEEAMTLAKDRDVLVISGACDSERVSIKGTPDSLTWFGVENTPSQSFIMHHFDNNNQTNFAGKIFDIHGLEHSRVLVIIGPDLYLDENSNVTVNKSMIGSFKASPSLPDEEVTELIKNTYRVLLTRGMEECNIYCCDDQLRQYFMDQG